jgi:hypothetical protein
MLFVWFLLLVALSLAPVHVKLILGTMGPFHAVGHLLAFGITTFLCLAKTRIAGLRITCALLLLALSALLEVLEAVLYRNPFEWGDLGLDTLAVTAVLGGFLAFAGSKESSNLQRL